MPEYARVEVEPNDNCPMMAYQVFRTMGEPFPVRQVRLYEGGDDGRLCLVTGWTSDEGGRAIEAYAVKVEDSSAGSAYVIYGGDWGLRLCYVEGGTTAAAWSIEDADQWGETHLVLADLEDIIPA